LSELILADANSWMTETLSRRKVDLQVSVTALVMQRLHQGDPSADMLERGHSKHFCLPCDTAWVIQPPELAARYQDGLLDPIRLPRTALEEALSTLGEAGYAGQYGENPVPRGGALFKVDRLLYEQALPTRWLRGPVRSWDKSGTRGGGAYTAGVKLAMDSLNRLWIMDVIRGQWDSGTRESIILETAKLDTKDTIVVLEQEPGSGGKESAEGTAKRLAIAGFRSRIIRPSGDKEMRAEPLSVLVNLCSVVICPGIWTPEFVKEMRFFPRGKYKDQIDAAAAGFSMLTKPRLRIGALSGKRPT
jgi:predicted phage terminase large subunit-like protein